MCLKKLRKLRKEKYISIVINKKQARMKRSARTRALIKRNGVNSLCVNRTSKHIYAQIFIANGSKVLVSASTLDTEIRGIVKYGGNIKAATAVGQKLGERAKQAGITKVAFDRSGFKYHGRIKALAEAAREQGLNF